MNAKRPPCQLVTQRSACVQSVATAVAISKRSYIGVDLLLHGHHHKVQKVMHSSSNLPSSLPIFLFTSAAEHIYGPLRTSQAAIAIWLRAICRSRTQRALSGCHLNFLINRALVPLQPPVRCRRCPRLFTRLASFCSQRPSSPNPHLSGSEASLASA